MSNAALHQRAPSHYYAALLGVCLLAVAVPYTVSQALLLRPAASLSEGIHLHQQALALFPDSSGLGRLAMLELSAARSGKGSWPAAAAALEAALKARPQDPLGWARLAYVYGELQQPQAVGAALARSVASGAYLPGFMVWRLLIGLKYWDALDELQRKLMAAQAQSLWHDKPNDFIRLSRMPALASQIENLMKVYYPQELEAFLQRRRPLRHNR